MIYRIFVDGKETIAYIPLHGYSRSADNRIREAIIKHYLDEEGAANVTIEPIGTESISPEGAKS